MSFKVDHEKWYSQLELAELRGCSKATLEAERCRGGSIPYSKWGRRVYYKGADIENYLNSQRRRSSSDDPAMPARVAMSEPEDA